MCDCFKLEMHLYSEACLTVSVEWAGDK